MGKSQLSLTMVITSKSCFVRLVHVGSEKVTAERTGAFPHTGSFIGKPVQA